MHTGCCGGIGGGRRCGRRRTRSGFGFRVRRSEPCWRWVWGFVRSPAGLAPTRVVLFDRQQGWLLRGALCSIASRAGGLVGGRGEKAGVGKTNQTLLRRALRRAYSQPLRLKNQYGRIAAASMTVSAAG